MVVVGNAAAARVVIAASSAMRFGRNADRMVAAPSTWSGAAALISLS